MIGYNSISADLFAELPVGPGFLTFEGCYSKLDLDDAELLASTGKTGRQSQGHGFVVQAGYYFFAFQPWFVFERWLSDGIDDRGSHWALRLGLTYFLKGQNANVKIGYEAFHADQNIGSTSHKRIDTFILGLYITY